MVQVAGVSAVEREWRKALGRQCGGSATEGQPPRKSVSWQLEGSGAAAEDAPLQVARGPLEGEAERALEGGGRLLAKQRVVRKTREDEAASTKKEVQVSNGAEVSDALLGVAGTSLCVGHVSLA